METFWVEGKLYGICAFCLKTKKVLDILKRTQRADPMCRECHNTLVENKTSLNRRCRLFAKEMGVYETFKKEIINEQRNAPAETYSAEDY